MNYQIFSILFISLLFIFPTISKAETEWEKYYRDLEAYRSQFLQYSLGDFSFTDGLQHTKKNPFSSSFIKPGDKKKRVGKVKFPWNDIEANITTLQMLAWGSEGDTPWKCFDNFKLMKNRKIVGTFKASDKNNWKVNAIDPERDKDYEYWTLLFENVKIPLKKNKNFSFEIYADAKKKPPINNAGKVDCGIRISIPDQNMIAEPKDSSQSKYKYYYLGNSGTNTEDNDLLIAVSNTISN